MNSVRNESTPNNSFDKKPIIATRIDIIKKI